MNRCSFCEWIPILPWPLWPLAGQFSLGQNVVVGSMTLLLAVRGKHCHEKYVWTPVCFTTAPYHGLVWSYPTKYGEKKRGFLYTKIVKEKWSFNTYNPRSRGLIEHGVFSCEWCGIPAHMQGWGDQ